MKGKAKSTFWNIFLWLPCNISFIPESASSPELLECWVQQPSVNYLKSSVQYYSQGWVCSTLFKSCVHVVLKRTCSADWGLFIRNGASHSGVAYSLDAVFKCTRHVKSSPYSIRTHIRAYKASDTQRSFKHAAIILQQNIQYFMSAMWLLVKFHKSNMLLQRTKCSSLILWKLGPLWNLLLNDHKLTVSSCFFSFRVCSIALCQLIKLCKGFICRCMWTILVNISILNGHYSAVNQSLLIWFVQNHCGMHNLIFSF